jgi:hypothetical protein
MAMSSQAYPVYMGMAGTGISLAAALEATLEGRRGTAEPGSGESHAKLASPHFPALRRKAKPASPSSLFYP